MYIIPSIYNTSLQGETVLSLNSAHTSAAEAPHRFSHFAMATEFVVLIRSADPLYAAQASQAAFSELDRLEQEFSRFQPQSDVARIRRLTPGRSMVVGLDTFSCLQKCMALYLATQGAFDVTVGSLYEIWLNPDKSLRQPTLTEIEQAGGKTGLHHLFLDESSYSVAVDLEGLQLDLGAIGKGYAVDSMAAVLKEWGIEQALLHGGTSSVYAFGREPSWTVSISHPLDHQNIYRQLALHHRAMGGSGLQKGQHIIDPRWGRPVHRHLASWVLAADAASADALSTAFMVMNLDEIMAFCESRRDIQAVVCTDRTSDWQPDTCWHDFGMDGGDGSA